MEISLFILIAFSLTIVYLLVISIITYGWFNLPLNEVLVFKKNYDIKLSIVIAVRNESGNIKKLLQQLVNQDYSSKYYEIIIVNDNSEDNTSGIIATFIKNNQSYKIILVESDIPGKKNAIKKGIEISGGELIITTDGDCNVGNKWLSSIVYYYISTKKKIITGPVVYNEPDSLVKKFFTVDFASLVASGAGSIGVGLPLIGNGANLAFNKDVYDDYNDQSDRFNSGDDVFLIHHAAKKYGNNSVGFLKNKDAIVQTEAPASISSFINQRVRWGSKATGYQLLWPVFVSIIIFSFNTILLLILVSGIVYNWMLLVYLLIIIVKYMIDAPLVNNFLRFSGRNKLCGLLFIFEFIYPIYIFYSAILSLTSKYSWKQRSNLT